MQRDKYTTFSDAQAVTADAASDVLNLKAIRNIGVGARPLYVVVQCVVAMTDSSSNSTCTVTVETDDAEAFSSATTTQTLGTFAALSPIGTRLEPMALIANEQWVRLKYTMANGNLTTGSFTAFLTPDPQLYTAFADNVTISTS